MATAMEDLRLLQDAEALCDVLWGAVLQWDDHARRTVGEQLVRSADSIGANVAESYARYADGEKIQFLYYGRGSLYESKFWLRRAKQRGLMTDENVAGYSLDLDNLAKAINSFIRSLRSQRGAEKGKI
ncbi:MAG TPA: four helix bundle protein [Caldilineaceae bacterium]|nr:four helix bundle protein [Caldilineaceae bacterium]